MNTDPKSFQESLGGRSAGRVPVLDSRARRLKPLEGKKPGMLMVNEIYRSLQGESTYVGVPCVFVRLTACHLRCVYCDTPHAFNQGEAMILEEVVHRVLTLGDTLVEITGGEPLLQAEVIPLMTRLADEGKTVLLETSGAVDTSPVDLRVHVILDCKTPGSGELEANNWSNLERLKPTDELKFVVCDRDDFDWSVKLVREHRLTAPAPSSSVPRSARSTQPSWPHGFSRRTCRFAFNCSSTRSSGIPRPGGSESY